MNKSYLFLIIATIFLCIALGLISTVLYLIDNKYNKKYNKNLENYIISIIPFSFISSIILSILIINTNDKSHNIYFFLGMILVVNFLLIILLASFFKNNINENGDVKSQSINIIYIIYLLTVCNGILFLYCIGLLIKKYRYSCETIHKTEFMNVFNKEC